MGGVAEFKLSSYDGETIKGRLLIGATVDPLVIDGRLIVGDLAAPRACGSKDRLKNLEIDMIVRPPRQDEIITIRPGFWYGREVKFLLLNNELEGMGTECIEGEIVVHTIDQRVAARLPIRVVRTDKPPTPPDGGKEEPRMPPSDAGAP